MGSPTSFLGELAVVLARAHTESSLVVAIAAFFARALDVEWVEIVTREEERDHRSLRASPSSDAASSSHRPLPLPPSPRNDSLPRILHPRAESKSPELRNAHRLGLRSIVVLPLHACDPHTTTPATTTIARLVIALRRPPKSSLSFEIVDLWTSLCDVTSAALASCHALARVGEVSRRAYRETHELRGALASSSSSSDETIVARSRVMRRLLDDVLPQVARHDVTALLLGESGVGKELIARRIHRLSRRAPRPMLSINCGAIPETLIDGALFGHERGAFTGATSRQMGIFERAHRGTLFLDEVGELSLAVQTKLLRVLEHGELERVGGNARIHVDVRIIAATNRDLLMMTRAGSFRSDLYHRLAVVPLLVPPLRERPEDIDALVPELLERIARRMGMVTAGGSRVMKLPTSAQMRVLRSRPWLGNVRELENVLSRALLLADRGGKLALDAALADERTERTDNAVVMTFAEASKRTIEAALVSSAGRIHGPGGAAERLKLKPTTLQSKMRKLGIARPRATTTTRTTTTR